MMMKIGMRKRRLEGWRPPSALAGGAGRAREVAVVALDDEMDEPVVNIEEMRVIADD